MVVGASLVCQFWARCEGAQFSGTKPISEMTDKELSDAAHREFLEEHATLTGLTDLARVIASLPLTRETRGPEIRLDELIRAARVFGAKTKS